MTPYEIEIMLHYNCTTTEFGRTGALAYQPTMQGLRGMELLKAVGEDGQHEITEKGRAYVLMLSNVPFPVKVTRWVSPDEASE